MYRTVIICLIVIGCVGAISPHHNGIVRDVQEPTREFIYPTYPEYTTQVSRPGRDVEKVEENKAAATKSKLYDYVRYYGSYAPEGIAVVVMSSSFAYLICGYTSICNAIKSMIVRRKTFIYFFFFKHFESLSKICHLSLS
jgi:hypothetical protein